MGSYLYLKVLLSEESPKSMHKVRKSSSAQCIVRFLIRSMDTCRVFEIQTPRIIKKALLNIRVPIWSIPAICKICIAGASKIVSTRNYLRLTTEMSMCFQQRQTTTLVCILWDPSLNFCLRLSKLKMIRLHLLGTKFLQLSIRTLKVLWQEI